MKPRLCARCMGWLHRMASCVCTPKECCTHRSSSDVLRLHVAVVACRRECRQLMWQGHAELWLTSPSE